MSVDVSWHYRQSLCTISVRDCFDSSSTSPWSFQRMNIQRQYSAILFLTMQDDKTPVIFIVSETLMVNFNMKQALDQTYDFRISIICQFTFYTTKLEMLIQNILQIYSGESKMV
ncbi:Hypothetical_protein [Hexamita inflata]|uniref:Hypothetical_protein n=1 Tax=Hexamita inflata TaxID=28002 RepID=A0AA86UE84_9EUKA|nr:Hypothetical protein HINF_LOCUS42315 [Hexamita inflata]